MGDFGHGLSGIEMRRCAVNFAPSISSHEFWTQVDFGKDEDDGAR